MVNNWTRDDLPDHVAIRDVDYMHGDGTRSRVIDLTLDMVVGHLNANHQKPEPDRWRRAHEIVERERDQAREERDEAQVRYRDTATALTEWHRRWVEMERERDQARESLHEACKVAQSYKVDAYQATERAEAAERELDEWKSRAEAAEARTAPAVSRADVAEALSRCINPEMWNVTFPSVVSEVCDLFGVEAGQAADPLLDKAQEFAALADWELTDREAELLHAVAAHVLGREVK